MTENNEIIDKEPCRNCNELTKQRAEGIPYCSMGCIKEKRRREENEVLECPYPECDWDKVYDPENGLSRTIAYKDIKDHRNEHREERDDLESPAPEISELDENE